MKTNGQVATGILLSIVGLALLLGLGWVVQGNDFFMYRFFAPKYEAVGRQVFEQTKSYQRGTEQELRQEMRDYAVANPDQKQALASLFLHEVDGYPNALPSDIQAFSDKLRGQP